MKTDSKIQYFNKNYTCQGNIEHFEFDVYIFLSQTGISGCAPQKIINIKYYKPREEEGRSEPLDADGQGEESWCAAYQRAVQKSRKH